MKYRAFLRTRYRAILGFTGLVSAIAGVLIVAPLVILPFYPEETAYAWAFLLPGLSSIFVGGLAWRLLKPSAEISLSYQEGAVIVVLSWILAILVGSLPFMLVSKLDFTRAMFESTSGWTTTGLSVIDVTIAPHVVLFYRSLMQLAGGAGFAIIALAALTGPLGSGLTAAEGRSEQLAPHVRRSAKLVLVIYLGYASVGCVALYLAGMRWFDAVNHAFAAVSTGGFSTRVESIGFWDSSLIEAVTLVLMFLGNLNFLTGYTLLQGRFKSVMRDGEIRLQAILYPIGMLVLFFGVAAGLFTTLGKALRVAIFETVTALTTTGFSTVSYSNWNSLGWLVLIIFMLIGGGAGSSAGSFKQFRVYILLRGMIWEIQRMLHPRSVVKEPVVWRGQSAIYLNNDHIRQVAVFGFLYFTTLLIGTTIMASYGYSIHESLFEFASTLGTVGISLGVTSVDAPTGMLWTQIVGMLMGRLEFFVVFIGITKIVVDLRALGLSK